MRRYVHLLVCLLILVPFLIALNLFLAPATPDPEEVLGQSRRTSQHAEQVLRDVQQRNVELDDRLRAIEQRGDRGELK
jgi:hypothetical protein